MPNAKDINQAVTGRPKFLLVGSPGSGKTTQVRTLHGKTFAYLFDPSALASLAGSDVEYELFIPDMVPMAAHALKKGVGDTPEKTDAGDVYLRWEKDFTKRLNDGFFDSVDNIIFDSLTTFSDIVMDRILKLNNREGRWPQQDDWTAQMSTIRNVFRTLTSQQNLILVATAHDQLKQDEVTTRMVNQIMVTGQLRVKLPLLFSDIWHLECTSSKTEVKFVAQTRPDRLNPTVRCSFRDLDFYFDVTIRDWDNPRKFGIGNLLATRGFYRS